MNLFDDARYSTPPPPPFPPMFFILIRAPCGVLSPWSAFPHRCPFHRCCCRWRYSGGKQRHISVRLVSSLQTTHSNVCMFATHTHTHINTHAKCCNVSMMPNLSDIYGLCVCSSLLHFPIPGSRLYKRVHTSGGRLGKSAPMHCACKLCLHRVCWRGLSGEE